MKVLYIHISATPDVYGLYVPVGVSRNPPRGDKRGAHEPAREGSVEGHFKCKQKRKKKAVIKKTDRHVFLEF